MVSEKDRFPPLPLRNGKQFCDFWERDIERHCEKNPAFPTERQLKTNTSLTIRAIETVLLSVLDETVFQWHEECEQRYKRCLGQFALNSVWGAKEAFKHSLYKELVDFLGSDVRRRLQEAFKHSADFISIRIREQNFTLTSQQAQAIQMLCEEWQNGTPDVGEAYILEKLGSPTSRLRDTFRSTPDAWKALIVCRRKGTVRLNLPTKPKS